MSGANQRFRDRRAGDPLIAERDWMPVIDALKRLSQAGLAGSVLYNSTGIYIRENNSIVNLISSIESINTSLGGKAGEILLAKTTTAHNKDAIEFVDFYSGGKGEETPTGVSFEVYNRFADLAADKWCFVTDIDNGFELIAGEC